MANDYSRLASVAIRATIGRRSQQEDAARGSVIALANGRKALLVVLADGMGGAVGGEVASACAVDAFAVFMATSREPTAIRLGGALDAANAAIAGRVAADPRLAGMGTTLIGVVVDGSRVDWVSVGDSLLLSAGQRGIVRFNADHSVGGMLDEQLARGEITAADAARGRRHLLRSALTGDPISMIDTGDTMLSEGDRLVLASDGILTLDLAELADLVLGAPTIGEAAEHAVEAIDALDVAHQDNMTIAVVVTGAS